MLVVYFISHQTHQAHKRGDKTSSIQQCPEQKSFKLTMILLITTESLNNRGIYFHLDRKKADLIIFFNQLVHEKCQVLQSENLLVDIMYVL